MQFVHQGLRRFPAGRGEKSLDLGHARRLVVQPFLDESPFLLGLGNHAVVPDDGVGVGLVKPVLGPSLLLTATAEFGIGDRADHVTDGPAVEEHLEPEFREAPTQLDILRAEAKLLPEHPVPNEEGALAG